MVLRYRHHPELLPLRALRPQLEIPLVQQARLRLGHRPAHHLLLHHRVVPLPLALRRPVPPSHLDPTHLRRRPRRSALVPDAVGHLGHGPLGALGGLPDGGRAPRSLALAVARCVGCDTGRRIRDDIVADADEVPYCVYARVCAGAGEHGDDCGEGDGAGQGWARHGVSESGAG